MKKVAIIQARMGSTRLPGKMMLSLGFKKVVDYVFDNVALVKNLDDIYLATTNNEKDDVLEKWAKSKKVKYFRGSEDDVLDRYYTTAKEANADMVVRLTGDCPLIDTYVVEKIIQEFLDNDFDYVANNHPATYPDGLDTEVFSFAALEKAWQEAKLKSEREHVTPYIWKNPDKFKIKNVENDFDLSNERWTLDTEEDYIFLKKLISECEKNNINLNMGNIITVIKSNPDWKKINSMYDRNEGYTKSINNDLKIEKTEE